MNKKIIFTKEVITFIEIVISLILFTFTMYHTKEVITINFSSIIGLILYFMIFVELVRALVEFIFEKEHRFKVKYIYDMGIIFLIREILVTITTKHDYINTEITYLSIASIILITLFTLRMIDSRSYIYNNTCDDDEDSNIKKRTENDRTIFWK